MTAYLWMDIKEYLNNLCFTRKNLTSCTKSAKKSSTSCVRTACPKTSCNNFVDIIRLVARLFQQVRYSHDITILLQPCFVNLGTFLVYIMTVSDLSEQPCNRTDMPSILLQVVNSLFQTWYNKWEQAVRTQLVDSLWTDSYQKRVRFYVCMKMVR
jgi:hypothetical protein